MHAGSGLAHQCASQDLLVYAVLIVLCVSDSLGLSSNSLGRVGLSWHGWLLVLQSQYLGDHGGGQQG